MLIFVAICCFWVFDAFFQVLPDKVYCSLSPDMKAMLRSLSKVWAYYVIHGFLFGKILMSFLMVTFSMQRLM